MSEKINFQIYYGEGEIRYCPEGVDLSGFRSVNKGISRANERSFGAICNWLMKCFKLDPEQFGLTVSAVTSRSNWPIYWEIVAIGGSTMWRRFVEVSTQRGLPLVIFVQAYEKIGGSSEMTEGIEEVDDHTEEHPAVAADAVGAVR